MANRSISAARELPISDRKRLIVILRFLILGTIILLATLAESGPRWEFWFVATVYLFSNFIYALETFDTLLSDRTSRWIFLFDVTLVTVLCSLAPAPSTDFWIPYFLTILLAAMAADLKIAVLTALVSSAVYGFVLHRARPEGARIFDQLYFLHASLYMVTALFVGALAEGARRDRHRRGGVEQALELSNRLADLFDLRRIIDLGRDPRALARYILDLSQQLFADDAGSLMLKDDRSGELRVAVARGLEPVEGRSDPDGIAAYICTTGETLLLIGSPSNDPRFEHLEPRPDIRSSISVPITHRDEVFGVLNFNRKSPTLPHFTHSDLHRAQTFAAHVGVALLNAKVFRELDEERLTTLDSLAHLRETHEQAIRTEKLTTLEEVVTSVARNLNDPLTGILGSAELARERLPAGSELRLAVDAILADAERCRNLVAQLQAVQRKQRASRLPTDIVKLLEEVLVESEPGLKRAGIALITDFAPGLHLAAIDRPMMARVFTHLVENAVRAMTSRTDAIRKLTVALTRVGGEIHVSFTDSGSGVSLDHIQSIFQPFFSTSGATSTGLGLSTAERLVRENGGRIRGISDGSEGSTFVVTLPVIAQNRPQWGVDGKREASFSWALPLGNDPEPEPATVATAGTEGDAGSSRLLLVDDDESVARVVSQALGPEFQVERAVSAERALEILRAREDTDDEEIVAVILDLSLAGGGYRLYENICKEFPVMARRIVLSSGSAPGPEASRILEVSASPFLAKPYHVDDLRDAVRAIASS